MKRYKRLSLLFTFVIIISLSGCSFFKKDNQTNVEQDFSKYLNELFVNEVSCDTISLHYTVAHPESYGITENIQTLGEYSIKQMNDDLIETENYLNALKKYNYEDLTEEEQLIYNILLESMTQNLKLGDYLYYQETLGPTTGLQAQLPILLAEYSFYDQDDVDTYLAMLDSVDEYFEEIGAFEKEKSEKGYFMTDAVADQIIEQCEDFIKKPEENYLIEVFDEKLEDLTELTADEITLYEEKNRTLILECVIPSYSKLIDTLNELKGTSKNSNGLCGLENGKEYYELMVQISTGSSKTVLEMKDALQSALEECRATMTSIALTNSKISEEYMNLKFPSSDPSEIINYLKENIKTDFPYLSDVDCTIKYVPESLQDHLSPAMYLIPPIDYYTQNNIYINNNSEYDMNMIFPTIAHEGYPGHLFQNVYFREQNPNPIRSVINITGYDEGWATYVELYSYNLANLSEELSSFLKANMIALHCLYSLTDIGIHYEGWSKSDTVKFWSTYGVERDTAEEVYTTILAEPGIYLPYSIGYLEIMELRNKAQKELGDKFVMKEFHEFLLTIGPTQFDIIEDYLDEWISSQK